jgi:hypothetical protein
VGVSGDLLALTIDGERWIACPLCRKLPYRVSTRIGEQMARDAVEYHRDYLCTRGARW